MHIVKTLVISVLIAIFSPVSAQNGEIAIPLNYDSLMGKVSFNRMEWKTLSARTRLIWNDGENEQDFQANIRVKKDSLIWMSLGILGIEGMRILITPDSFYLLNKLTYEYAVRDFGFLQKWLLFPVSFKMLQDMIEGDKISIQESATRAGKEDSSTVLYSESDKLLEKIWVDTAHYTLEKVLLKDKMLKQDLAVTFDSYNPVPNGRHNNVKDRKERQSDPTDGREKQFSFKRNISIHRDANTVTLDMEFTKINFDGDLEYPFEVGEKYKRIE